MLILFTSTSHAIFIVGSTFNFFKEITANPNSNLFIGDTFDPSKVPADTYSIYKNLSFPMTYITGISVYLLGIIGIICTCIILIGGYQYLVSHGNEEAVGKAKKTLTWAIVGLLTAIFSFSIINVVLNLITAPPTS